MEEAEQSPGTRVSQQGGALACGSRHRSLSREQGLTTVPHTRLLEQGCAAEEPGNITCVVSWEASPWFCIPLAFPFLWKHIFPRVSLHWNTISGSVVLQKTKEIKGKWKSSYHLLPGDTLIRGGSSARFGSPSTKIGTIQSRLLLRKKE